MNTTEFVTPTTKDFRKSDDVDIARERKVEQMKTIKPLHELTEIEWQDMRHVLRQIAYTTQDPEVKNYFEKELEKFARTWEEQCFWSHPQSASSLT